MDPSLHSVLSQPWFLSSDVPPTPPYCKTEDVHPYLAEGTVGLRSWGLTPPDIPKTH